MKATNAQVLLVPSSANATVTETATWKLYDSAGDFLEQEEEEEGVETEGVEVEIEREVEEKEVIEKLVNSSESVVNFFKGLNKGIKVWMS